VRVEGKEYVVQDGDFLTSASPSDLLPCSRLMTTRARTTSSKSSALAYAWAIETPIDETPASPHGSQSRPAQARDMQPSVSFKLRGAYNKMWGSPDGAERGVIAASAGNHARGRALSAAAGMSRRHRHARHHTRIKVDAVVGRGRGGGLVGDSYDEAYRHAKLLERRRG